MKEARAYGIRNLEVCTENGRRGWPQRHRRAEQRKKEGGSFVTNG